MDIMEIIEIEKKMDMLEKQINLSDNENKFCIFMLVFAVIFAGTSSITASVLFYCTLRTLWNFWIIPAVVLSLWFGFFLLVILFNMCLEDK